MSESLYFIAIVPPQDIRDQITELKNVVSEKFGSSHALNAPPHITLHMPFKWKDKRIGELSKVMKDLNDHLPSFEIQLRGFDCFEPRVVFVNVVENEALDELQKTVIRTFRRNLNLDNANYKDHPFHPHVTIAYRDLKKSNFYEAWEYFEEKEFRENFEVGEVILLKHDGGKWNVAEV